MLSIVCSMYSSSAMRSSTILCSGGSQSDLRMNGSLGAGGSPGFFLDLKMYSFLIVVANSSKRHLVRRVTFFDGTGQNLKPLESTFFSASVSIILVKFIIFPSNWGLAFSTACGSLSSLNIWIGLLPAQTCFHVQFQLGQSRLPPGLWLL